MGFEKIRGNCTLTRKKLQKMQDKTTNEIYGKLVLISATIVNMMKENEPPSNIVKTVSSALEDIYSSNAINNGKTHLVTEEEEKYFAEAERKRIVKYAAIISADKNHVFRVMRRRLLEIGIPFEENYKLAYAKNGRHYKLRFYIPCDRLCIEISDKDKPTPRDKEIFKIKIKTVRIPAKQVICHGKQMQSLVKRLEKLNENRIKNHERET